MEIMKNNKNTKMFALDAYKSKETEIVIKDVDIYDLKSIEMLRL
jgi:hypothetical protein